MPRRDTYLTDDDDTPRRAAASGGGVPGWVWLVGGGGGFLAVVVVGFGLYAMTARRAEMRDEAARENILRAEVHARAMGGEGEHFPGDKTAPGGPVVPLARIAHAYKTDAGMAATRYSFQKVRVRVVVTANGVYPNGAAWAGAAVDLGDGPQRGPEPNVIFRLAEGSVPVGSTVVIEGRCDGRHVDPRGGESLYFVECRAVPE